MTKPILRHAPHFHMLTPSRNVGNQPGRRSMIQIVDEPLVWCRTDKRIWFEVPVGFVFDGASVPNILYPVLEASALDLIIPGACHDYLYRKDALVIDTETKELREVERDEADEVLRDVCKEVGVDRADRDKIFFGVRAGGWPSFRKKKVGWRPKMK